MVPREPSEIKEHIRRVRMQFNQENEISLDYSTVWSFNMLPRYLWDYWKDDLKSKGISWQKFLRILKLRTADMIEWGLKSSISWNELVKRIEATIDSYSSSGEKS